MFNNALFNVQLTIRDFKILQFSACLKREELLLYEEFSDMSYRNIFCEKIFYSHKSISQLFTEYVLQKIFLNWTLVST